MSLVSQFRRGQWAWVLLAVCILGYSLVFLTLAPSYGPSFIVFAIVPVIVASAFFGLRVSVLASGASVLVTLLLAGFEGDAFVRLLLQSNWPIFVLTAVIGFVVGHFHDLQRARDAELSERRRIESRLQTLNQINQAIVRGGSPEEIGQGVVERVGELLQCDCVTLLVYDADDVQSVQVLAAYNRTYGNFHEAAPTPVLTPQRVHRLPEDDVLVCPIYGSGGVAGCAATCGLSLGSYVSERLVARSRIVGALALGAVAPKHFNDEILTIVRELSAQLAIALDNARLQAEQRRYVQELEALRDATLQLTSRLDRKQVLGTILQHALNLMHTDNGHIFLYDGENLSFGAALWGGAIQSEPLMSPREDGLTMSVIKTKQRIVVSDASHHPIYKGFSFEGAIVGAPLIMSGRVEGVMSLAYDKPHPFSARELRMLDLFADHAAIAVYNTRLMAQVQDQNNLLEARVTERTAELMAANKSIEAVLENSTDAVIIMSASTARVEHINRTAREWFGLSPDDLFINWRDVVEPEYQEAVHSAFNAVLTSGEPMRMELTLAAPNAPRYVDVALTHDNPDGNVGRLVCSLRDLTARKQAEEASIALVDGLREVVSAAYALLDCQTLDDLYRQAIERARTGLGLERCGLFIPRDEKFYGTYGVDGGGNVVEEYENSFAVTDPVWSRWLERLRQNNAQWVTDVEPLVEWRDGELVEIGVESWVTLTPLRTPNGLVGLFFNDAGLTGQKRDVNRQELVYVYVSLLAHILTRKQLEVDLRQSLAKERELNELKSRFVSMVSHEFRTPLTIIQSSGDMLRYYRERLSDTARIEKLDTIQAQILHLTGLLDDILAISRAETLGLEIHRDPTDLLALCHALVKEFEGTSHYRQISLKLVGAPRHVTIDARLMRQAISNLISNALKYSPDAAPVEIELHYRTHYVSLLVSDHGIGIPEADREQIFEAFHRASNVDNVSGTGLGLALVKHIVDLHEGVITCESTVGKGTTFHVRLPQEL